MTRDTILDNLTLATVEQYKLLGDDGQDPVTLLSHLYHILAKEWSLDTQEFDGIVANGYKQELNKPDLAIGFEVPTNAIEIIQELSNELETLSSEDAQDAWEAIQFLKDYWTVE